MTKWTNILSFSFWAKRVWKYLTRDVDRANRIQRLEEEIASRVETIASKKREFTNSLTDKQQGTEASTSYYAQEAQDLEFWMVHSSWTYCEKCNQLYTTKMMQNFSKRPEVKTYKTCTCEKKRYVVPKFEDVPQELRNLSEHEVRALRPLDIHTGDYERHKHGYRRKGGMFRLTWSEKSVQEKIEELGVRSKRRCEKAYSYLMNSSESCYSHFIKKREEELGKERFNLYDYRHRTGVECCVWPQLYPFKSWCETVLDGRESRLSSKISYMTKVMSEIADYGLMHEVLHFHYDLWLWQTVSRAISQGKKMKCTPNKALESKTFSTEYWRWQHRYLMDAVNQFGPPDLFITISPFEWTFPQPPWLQKLREQTGHGPTNLSAFETIHIVNVLEQVVRGYLTGSNSNRWTTQVFNYDYKKDKKNVKTYFYHFEFQDRGTVHLHMLVWLTDMTKVKLNVFRADVPWNKPDLAYLASDLQKSNTSALHLKTTATEVTTDQGTPTLSLYHPADAFELNLRGYISSLLPSLKCRMDVQSSDGKGMILKYVASYVSKWHDAYANDALFSLHVGPYQAAYRHLRALRPLEPEMWMSLSSQKIAWTNSRTKSITVPTRGTEVSKVYKAYLERPKTQEQHSFLKWLRIYDGNKKPAKLYKQGTTTLVGTKMRSVFADHFFHQYNVLHIAHRKPEDLYHPDDATLPVPIKCFAAAWLLSPDLWNDCERVKEYFSLHGNKEEYVMNVVQHVRSRIDFIHLWQRRVVGAIGEYHQEIEELTQLSPEQHRIVAMIRQAMEDRKQSYEDVPERQQGNLLDSESSDETLEEHAEQATSKSASAADWKKFILINGKPGTGKTYNIIVSLLFKR